MSTSDTAKLKEEFLVWLQDLELDCVSDCDELPNDFNPIFQSVKLKPLWQYLIKHVKNEETALKIYKNLYLQNLRTENHTLRQSCDDMSDELAKVNLDLQRLEEKVKQKRIKCSKASFAASKFQKSIDSHNMKSLFHEQCANDISIRDKSLKLLQKQFKNAYPSHSQLTMNDGKFFACSSELKKLLLLINNHYKKGFCGEADSKNTDLWKTINEILFAYPPKIIIDALSLITRQDGDELASDKSCKEDEKDEITTEETPMKTVQKMMENHHLESANEFQEALKCEAMAGKIERSNKQSLAQMLDSLPTGTNRKQVQELLEAEMKLKGEEAFLKSLQSSVQNLKTELDQSYQTQRQLAQMQQEMNDFNKELAKNKLEIIETTRQNADFRKKLINCQQETIQLAGLSLREKQDYLSRMCSIYQDALKEEHSSLQSADLFKLMTLEFAQKKIPLHSLSIYRQVNDNYEFGHQAYQQLLSLLGVNNHRSPADFFRDVARQMNDQQLQKHLDNFNKTLIPKESKIVAEVKDITDQSLSKCPKHSEKLLSWIKQAEKSVTVLKEEECKLKDALTDWYEQPAQNHAPWLEVGGENLKKWKEDNLSSCSY